MAYNRRKELEAALADRRAAELLVSQFDATAESEQDLAVDTLTATGNVTVGGTIVSAQDITITNGRLRVGVQGEASNSALASIHASDAASGQLDIRSVDNKAFAITPPATATNGATITFAAQSAVAVWTVPDTNGDAGFVMTAAAQTIGGAKTFSAAGVFSSTLGVTGVLTPSGGTGVAIGTAIPRNIGTWTVNSATAGTDTACSNGTAYVGSVFIPANCTITGVQYLIGSVGGTDKVISSLHDSAGTLLANSDQAGVTVGTAANLQQVAFTATYAAEGPGWYFLALTFNGTTAKFRSIPVHCNVGTGVIGNGVAQTFGTSATFTAPTTFTADKVPVASLY